MSPFRDLRFVIRQCPSSTSAMRSTRIWNACMLNSNWFAYSRKIIQLRISWYSKSSIMDGGTCRKLRMSSHNNISFRKSPTSVSTRLDFTIASWNILRSFRRMSSWWFFWPSRLITSRTWFKPWVRCCRRMYESRRSCVACKNTLREIIFVS